jgi:DNA polymerase elongation subunit (family B)
MPQVTCWDVETVSLSEADLPPFDESTVALGNVKDPEKIKAKVAQARADYISEAALSPMTGQIAMVGFRGSFNKLIYDGSEKDIIREAMQVITAELYAGNLVVGWNSSYFDLPYIIKRGWAHGITTPKWREGRYFNRSLVDLRDEWLLGERTPARGTSSLEAVAKFMGLPPKLGSGEAFAAMTKEQRIAYLERDLELTEAIYNRMNRP